MKNQFIIFLDIDGVLNNESMPRKGNFETKEDRDKSQFSPRAVALLNDLCETTKSDVVISSSWRVGRSLDELKELMTMVGCTFNVIGKTPTLGVERGCEISRWLRENITVQDYGCHYFDFKRYAILDDESDMLLNQQQHFFQTNNAIGLTTRECYKITNFFKSLKV